MHECRVYSPDMKLIETISSEKVTEMYWGQLSHIINPKKVEKPAPCNVCGQDTGDNRVKYCGPKCRKIWNVEYMRKKYLAKKAKKAVNGG